MDLTLDSINRADFLRGLLIRKPSLYRFYSEIYARYQACLDRCPAEGIALELGAGVGFAKDKIPQLLATDLLPYPQVDRIVDATQMPFEENSLRGIFMCNVFHHIPDVGKFLSEAERCLKIGGRIWIEDQYSGWISRPVLKYIHHENYDEDTQDWSFISSGPLSGANGALAWIVFVRDRNEFERRFPKLRVVRLIPHSPLKYWLTGGLKTWSLLPTPLYALVGKLDKFLVWLSPKFASFMSVEIERIA